MYVKLLFFRKVWPLLYEHFFFSFKLSYMFYKHYESNYDLIDRKSFQIVSFSKAITP